MTTVDLGDDFDDRTFERPRLADAYEHLRITLGEKRRQGQFQMPTDTFRPAPQVLHAPLTTVYPTARELLAQMMLDLGLFAALHSTEPDPADPEASMLDRQWLYWEPVVLRRDGAVLWNAAPLQFPGVALPSEAAWVGLSADRMGEELLFAGELPERARTSVSGGPGNRAMVTVPTGTIRISIA